MSLGMSIVATSVLVAVCICGGRRPAAQPRSRSRQRAHVAGPPPNDRLAAAARQNGMISLLTDELTLSHAR